MKDQEQIEQAITQMVPDGDPSLVSYVAAMMLEYEEDMDDDILEFLGDLTSSEPDSCHELLGKIKALVIEDGNAAGNGKNDDSEATRLLDSPFVMGRAAKEVEEQIAKSATVMFKKSSVNANEALQGWTTEDVDESPEEMAARAKSLKKEARREKKALKRERVIAPRRTAILESLTSKPVVIHDVIGEDGSVGGSPCVDIHMKDINIDLAGLPILQDATVTLAYGRKYGLIGRNGVGKTTFLKHVAAKALEGIPWYLQVLHIEQEVAPSQKSALQMVLETDEERETLLSEKRFIESALGALDEEEAKAYEESKPFDNREWTVPKEPINRLQQIYQRLGEIDADEAEPRASAILAGLSFTPEMMRMPIQEFSGGWRMRISLARALFIQPDVLLLDEPTNHLDLHAVLWLENYLKSFESTVVIVSHARGFLNEVCTDILLMRGQKVHRFKGNYDSFESQLYEEQMRDERFRAAEDKRRKELEHFITKNIGGGAKGASMAKSRQKMLEKMKPTPDSGIYDSGPNAKFKFPNPGPVSGGFGIRLVGVGFHYPEKPILFRNVDFSINQNSRICLVGPNGIGKSTLLKIVYEELEPTEGMVTRNPRLRVGRFSQHHVDMLSMKKSAVEKLQEEHPKDPPQKIRKHLGSMGVTGELQIRPINTLSGGQKSRVALASISYDEPHLLLLDEPTNHLDLETVQALIHALSEYKGGVMIVSHDEHLISAVCDELWIIRDQKVILSDGDFEDYKRSIQKSFDAVKGKY